MTIQINGEWEDSRIYSSSSTTDTNRYNSMGGEFWFYYHWMQIPLLNYTKQSSLPHNFWGKEENQSVTNHHGAFCCHNLCFHPVHRASDPPEYRDQVRPLAAVMYRSVTNWVIIRAHKHPFIVVIGLILHPSSILRRGSSDCKYNCFGCTRRGCGRICR